jgi:hypothetical protein
VFLDVTVLDKKGRPVESGLTKDDFTITEDKIPQTIFSFEAPEVHVMGTGGEDESPRHNGAGGFIFRANSYQHWTFSNFVHLMQGLPVTTPDPIRETVQSGDAQSRLC